MLEGLLSLVGGWIGFLGGIGMLFNKGVAIVFALLGVAIAVYASYVPIQVAKLRGFNGVHLKVITILAFCGLVVGLSWIVALALVFLWRPNDGKWIWEKASAN
jgi:hypothetical protein